MQAMRMNNINANTYHIIEMFTSGGVVNRKFEASKQLIRSQIVDQQCGSTQYFQVTQKILLARVHDP